MCYAKNLRHPKKIGQNMPLYVQKHRKSRKTCLTQSNPWHLGKRRKDYNDAESIHPG